MQDSAIHYITAQFPQRNFPHAVLHAVTQRQYFQYSTANYIVERCNVVQGSAARYSTILQSTTRITSQRSAAQRSAAQRRAEQSRAEQSRAEQSSAAQRSAARYVAYAYENDIKSYSLTSVLF